MKNSRFRSLCRFFSILFALSFTLSGMGRAFASPMEEVAVNEAIHNKGPDLSGVGITEKLGASIDQNLHFTDESGKVVRLGDYFKEKRPVIVSLAYYSCPMLCGIILNSLVDGMKQLSWTAGKEFALINVSIDPREKPALAAAKKKSLIAALGKPEAAAGWHFLTGEESQIKALASELGFGYRWEEKEKQYAHGAGVFVLTPDGKISRVLYGIEYKPSDLRLALLEASNGKIGTIVDRVLLFCFSYNPVLRRYSLTVMRAVQVGAVLTILALGGLIAFLKMRGTGT